MKSKEIAHIISQGENEKVEFKELFNTQVIETIIAFANTKGGRIFIGVNDDNKILGLKHDNETIQNWYNQIKQSTQPSVFPDIELIEIENKLIAQIKVDEFPVKPISVKGKYFKRVKNSNHQMSLSEISDEYLKTINSSWDFYIDPNHNFDDISIEKVAKFISKIEENQKIKIEQKAFDFLSKFEIIRNNQLTFGAYLLFVKENCLISDIQIGRFKSEITIIDSISIETDLFTALENTIAFIRKHLMVEFIITGNPQHEERFDYPLEAIREIVVNMIVHRDYRDSSGSIIKIFDDRIEFFNKGTLFGGITIEDLLADNYSSQTRNKLIAKAFKETGIIEKYGTGIKRILTICKNYKVISPKFEEVFNGFKVTLYKEKLNVGANDPLNDPLNVRQIEVLNLIKENKKITKEDVALITQFSLETIKRDFNILIKNNYIKRLGSKKTGYWEIIK